MDKKAEILDTKDYTGFDNPTILNYLAPKQKVLDVGCSVGELGATIKERFGSYVYGVDISSQNVEHAKKRLDKAIAADIEADFELDEKDFDVIILADILEHLYDPWSCIKRLKKYLKPGGYFIISIPNVANWHIRLRLLFGNFDYEKAGILDNTHIRFFTFKSLKKMLDNAGLEIKTIDVTHNIYISLLSRLLAFRRFARFVTRLNKNLLARQFIIVARCSLNDNVREK